MKLLERLKDEILIGDGAMGTLLYSYGVDFCFEELNTSQPERIEQIHLAYLKAGSDVIQTNTYGANYIKLARYGLEDQVKKLNEQACRIAKRASKTKEQTHVLGTMGGLRGIRKQDITLTEVKRTFREQLYPLLTEDVDGLLLETYYDFTELKTVLEIARKETDKPIVAQLSLHEVGVLQDGTPLAEGLKQLAELGANVTGVNCRLGPYHIIQSLEQVPLLDHAYLSAYPNASLPDYVDGRFIYESDASYFEQCALDLREQGVRLLGGCCGTTPEHIQAFHSKLKGQKPVSEKVIKPFRSEITVQQTKREEVPLQDIAKERRSVIVELDPPKHLDTQTFFEGTKALKEAGIDALTLADNSLASPRISNTAMATIAKNEYKTRPLVHLTCRDRNLIGLQSHLMGLHTLGLHDVLAVTGDPTKVGDFPGASSVYDLSSFELIQYIKQLNEGVSFSGKPLKQKCSFSVGAAFNPNVRHLEKAVQRLEKKIEYGADYFISQPIFSRVQIEEIYQATKHLTTPIYIGIMPLVSSKNAEFLHHEVPGIKLSDQTRERMVKCGTDKESAQSEGIAIAKELIDTAMQYFNGIYLITPFMRYKMTATLAHYIHQKDNSSIERKVHHV
ncbi:bifunctional homocysteine S-methyltransferase/methylenetetrahydrofolate reductase [Bacillus solimangrovi]|uniref:Bifunctional homocysteine S-methyltransferase/methylenetetrahydrofolate reductase n=1 Tax=Bacillus solimangrovi TaxID=1305675 RepID=A0A1E5LC33_9BACI|nr:bifunctional homocysteine S-methyltransferase/methylenetetrahydrofolate reductase [Bacillus solimangrovi]OEH91655.1 bifunctional homocysteine S-methyltransferase/methylenetetrahydrofolate reductase [Bacillus solimangrovi]